MGLRSSLKGLPGGLKGFKIRSDKPTAVDEKLTSDAGAVYAVHAEAAKEEEGTGLTPPPVALTAPWAVKPQAPPPAAPKVETAAPASAATKQGPAPKPATDNGSKPSVSVRTSPQSVSNKPVPAAAKAGEVAQGAPDTKRAEALSSLPKLQQRPAPVVPAAAKGPIRPKLNAGLSRIDQAGASTRSETEPGPSLAKQALCKPLPELTAQPDAAKFMLPPAIRLEHMLQREESMGQTASESGTPLSIGSSVLESAISSGTVVVTDAHQAKLSLSLTASIEDYAKKADPSNWGPAKFRKSQFVRVQPGMYPVPHKKLSESRSQYTSLDAFTKGTIHQIHKETDTRDPREFVADEGLVLYRVWVPQRVNSNVEFIFVEEHQMTVFRECTFCSAYATEQCGGCKTAWYCSEECLADDWRTHRADCKLRGRTPPQLGDRPAESVCSDTPASSVSPQPGGPPGPPGPRRKFRTDGTVKIINGYKPSSAELRGRTTIMPACLRPLTVEEEMAPLPESRAIRILRAVSHRLRRRIYRKRMILEAQLAQEAAEAQAALQEDTIPEGIEEGSDGEADEGHDDVPRHDEDDEGAGPRTGALEGSRDIPDGPTDGQGQAGEGSGNTCEGADGGEFSRPAPEGRAGNDEPSAASEKSNGGRSQRRQARSNEAPGSGRPRKQVLADLKPSKSMLAAPGKHVAGGRAPHVGSFNGIFRRSNRSSIDKDTPNIIVSEVTTFDEGACSETEPEDFGSPAGSYEGDTGSPGAESLVEGQPPRQREQRRRSAQQSAQALPLPQLPRIRVRPEEAPMQASLVTRDTSSMKTPQPWPLATAASLNKVALKKTGSVAAQPSRSDSLPEVFRRLISGTKHASLGVKSGKEDGSPSTKKTAKPRSPFKRHAPCLKTTALEA